MTRLVLFDIDGTLIATGGAGVRAFGNVARSVFGKPAVMERLSFAGRTDPSIVREFLAIAGIEIQPDSFTRFFDDYIHWLAHHLEERPGRVLPGVREAISTLRNLPDPPLLGLLTGNIRLGAELKLRHYDLWSEFVVGAFGDDHEHRNHLAAIARARGEEWLGTRLADEEILVIGDTPHDIACARAIGAPCLAVAPGGSTLETLREHGPAWAVPDLLQIDLARICGRRP
jgi:phosphoglycolate phosphatase-like HAD superfamily hydrolase